MSLRIRTNLQLPCACIPTGAFGGIRAAMQLRAMTGELGCPSVPKIFAIPKTHEVLDEAGKPVGQNNHLVKGIDLF